MICSECGRLVCPLRNSPHVVSCREFASHEIMARVLQNEPPNEKMIRGIPSKGALPV